MTRTPDVTRRRRWRWVAVPLVLVGGLVIGGYLLAAPREDIPMPSKDATPEQVVEAYTDAINARDYRTSNALFPDAAGAPRSLFSGYERIDLKSIDNIASNRKSRASVYFTAEFKGGDRSLSGLDTWAYHLERSSDGHWVIVDQGIG